jgi:hypothetical protein
VAIQPFDKLTALSEVEGLDCFVAPQRGTPRNDRIHKQTLGRELVDSAAKAPRHMKRWEGACEQPAGSVVAPNMRRPACHATRRQ